MIDKCHNRKPKDTKPVLHRRFCIRVIKESFLWQFDSWLFQIFGTQANMNLKIAFGVWHVKVAMPPIKRLNQEKPLSQELFQIQNSAGQTQGSHTFLIIIFHAFSIINLISSIQLLLFIFRNS